LPHQDSLVSVSPAQRSGSSLAGAEVLLAEPRWVALPDAHPLAARDQICFSDLRDEPFVAAPAETGWWRDRPA
jgi:DNA-binding transcriptional LysR family regulator